MHFVMIRKLWLYGVCCTCFLLGRDAKGGNYVLLLFSEEGEFCGGFFLSPQLLGETTWILSSVDVVLYKYSVFLNK